MQYILGVHKGDGCILCDKPAEKNDEENYILYRTRHGFIILNAYPYISGHLMVAPYRHIGNITDTNSREAKELFALTQLCVKLLTLTMKPDGYNIGMNIGKVAGAGLEGHIHMHIVPRWDGGNNYMSVVADTRVLSEGLAATYGKLREGLSRISA
jgi:ATP adenylyltransferase